MAITYIDGAGATYDDNTVPVSGPTTSFPIPVPTAGGALVEGDFLVAAVSYDVSDTTAPSRTLPSGWTTITGLQLLGSGTTTAFHEGIYHRVTAGEAGTTPSWVLTPNGATAMMGNVAVSRFRGVDAASPFAKAAPIFAGTMLTTGAITAPSITTTAANTMLVTGFGIRNGSATLTSVTPGYTVGGSGFSGQGRSVGLAHKALAAQGASGTAAWNLSTTSNPKYAWQTALKESTTVAPQTYYVAGAGGSDTANGTSTGTPWATIAKVNSTALVPGDTVLFQRGQTFANAALLCDNSGTSASRITFGAYGSGAKPIFDGGGGAASAPPIMVTGNYVTMQDVQTQNAGTGVTAQRGISWVGTDGLCQSVSSTGNTIGLQAENGAHRLRVTGSEFSGNTTVYQPAGATDDYGASGVVLQQADDVEVDHCTFTGNYGPSVDFGIDGSAVEIYGAVRAVIHHNVSTDCPTFSELGHVRTDDVTFHNNLIIGTASGPSGAAAVNAQGTGTFGPVTNIKFHHNTAVLRGADPVGVVLGAGVTASIHNNVVESSYCGWFGGEKKDEGHNVWFGNTADIWSTATAGSNAMASTSTSASPQFVSTTDYHLQATSPAVNRGIDLGYTTDYDGSPRLVGAAPDAGAYESTVTAPAAPTLLHRVLGIPSGTAVPIQARTTSATSVRAQVSTSSTFASGIISGSAVTPNAQGDSQLTVTGLAAGTTYWHRIGMTVGGAETFSAISSRSFRTAPTGPANFAFNFGSCTDATDSASMSAIAARNDDLFFHVGDLYYNDARAEALTDFRAEMLGKIQAPNHAAVFAGTPTSYTPSDHDGMANNTNAGNNPTPWTFWNAAYRELFPTLDLPGSLGVYRSFTWGRVRFIQLDRRSFASDPAATDNASKTCLGATQKQWLKDTITNATEPVIVIVQESPWVGAASGGDDGWMGFTTERTELANFFAASGKPIVMLAGDMHAVAADNGTNAPGGITVFQAAPLRQGASIKGGPYSVAPYPASGTTEVQQYGRVVVTDNGSSVSLVFTGYSSDNTARVTLTETVVPQAFTGAAGLGGSGTLTASPKPGVTRTAALGGSGTLAVAGQTPAVARAAALTSSGSLSTAQLLGVTRPAALSGAGALSTTQRLGMIRPAALSGVGSLSTTQLVAFIRAAALAGSGTLSTTQRAGFIKAAALAGSGTLIGDALGFTSAGLSGAGSLTTTQAFTGRQFAALSGAGSLTAAQFRVAVALAAVLAGSGKLAAVTPSVPLSASLTGVGHLSTWSLNLLRFGGITPATLRLGGTLPIAVYLGQNMVWRA